MYLYEIHCRKTVTKTIRSDYHTHLSKNDKPNKHF